MLKKLLILICCIAFLTLVIFVINNTGSLNTTNGNDEQLIDALRVGVHYDVKNMGYRQYYDDELSGFEIEFAKQLAKHLYGNESLIEMTGVSMETAKYYLNDNKIDCIIATQPLAEKKTDGYEYSKPYYTDYIECMYSSGSILSLNDLAGKRIGVITDSYAHTALKNLLDSSKLEAEFVNYESYDDAFYAIQLGKIDAFCGNRAFVASTNLKRFTVTECKYSVVVRSKDSELLNKINDAIDYMESSGELKQLQDKYKQ